MNLLRPGAPAAAMAAWLLLAAAAVAERAVTGAAPAACPGGLRGHLDLASFRLDNGMRFLLVEHPDRTRVVTGWIAHAGAADDPRGLTGISHVLEHMMFKGTRTIGVARAGELDELYGRAGATLLNAFTRTDFTAFVVAVPANALELWFWLESDRLMAPVFRGLDAERKVIEQERQRSEAAPGGRLQRQLNALFWQGHPYGWPLFGWPWDVAAVTETDLERHFATWYTPGNVTAVLVGHLDRAAVEALARRYFGRIPARPEPPRGHAQGPEQLAETRMSATIEGRAQLVVRYHSVAFRHPDSYPLEVLADLLDGPAGRLQAGLVEPGLADEAAAAQVSWRQGGCFTLTASARGDRTPEELEQAWYEVLRRLAAAAVPPAELERAKNHLVADALRKLQDPVTLLAEVLGTAGLGEWSELEDHACRVAAVSAEEVRRVALTYFQPQNRTVGLLHAARAARRASGS